jgi:hypothetical protein
VDGQTRTLAERGATQAAGHVHRKQLSDVAAARKSIEAAQKDRRRDGGNEIQAYQKNELRPRLATSRRR